MHGLPRRRVHHLATTTILTTVLSVLPFITIYSHRQVFQPPALRFSFFICIALSWIFSSLSTILSILISALHRSMHPCRHYIATHDVYCIIGVIISVVFALSSLCLLVVAQSIWTYVASRAQIIWILCLSVLGLATLVILTFSVFLLLLNVIQVRNQQSFGDVMPADKISRLSQSQGFQLEIQEDAYSPQRIVTTIPGHDSELVF